MNCYGSRQFIPPPPSPVPHFTIASTVPDVTE